ncbi:hypothetical protein [Streptomyces sp. L7]|uniref:hypothetical protein n=1 Tax=Streptomyces sp. L7 TaxID=3423954 RepID=UPI003D9611D7
MVQTINGTVDDMVRPGALWPAARDKYLVEYRVLAPEYNPMSDPAAAAAMVQTNVRLHQKLPQLVTQIRSLMSMRAMA